MSVFFDGNGNHIEVSGGTGVKLSPEFDRVQIIAHACNTADKFAAYIEKGYRFIECDVQFTSDFVFVTNHDDGVKIGETTVNISESTFDELVAAGYTPQKLSDLMAKCRKHNMCLYMDIKRLGDDTANRLQSLYDLAGDYGMLHSVVFGSLGGNYQNILSSIDNTLVLDTSGSIENAKLLKNKCALVIVHISYSTTTPEAQRDNIIAANRAGIKIYPWTVDNADIANTYLNYGASWVMSNNLLNSDID